MDGVSVERAIGRDRIRAALKRYENRPTDEHKYGVVRAVNADGSYEVQLDGDVQPSRCSPFAAASVGERVLVVTKRDGTNDLLGRLGGGSGGGTSAPDSDFAERDPTVPAWAKQQNPPTYTAADVGADPAGSAAAALGSAKAYADEAVGRIEVPEVDLSDYALKTDVAAITSRLSEVVLFEGGIDPSTGKALTNQDAITLSDSAANYDMFEIYYVTNDTHWAYTKVLDPNGKNVMLMGALVGSADLYMKLKCININGKNVTVAYTADSAKFFAGEGALVGGTLTRDKRFITITKIVGHPKTA